MKQLTTIVLLFSSLIVFAQKEISPSNEFVIAGQIQRELKFTLADLEKLEAKKIDDVVVTNHLGEKKGTAKDLKGIQLKGLLDKIEFKTESPKVLREFYLTFVTPLY